ncbi:MAG TPA: Gfo/Idh/MocA family oxidoreductase [Steroidobacteraceae bacterium]|nr:Gfo/Idh/MocA family oxidoreductase [Steroidobacteraceae bacterium]
MRVGIVGARYAASFHFESYRRLYGVPVRVAGVYSVTPDSREAFARERQIAAYSTFEELCDACDVIDVCTPPGTHAALAIEALQRGKHVIVEKPFTGFFGPPGAASGFRGDRYSKEVMLREAVANCQRILEAMRASGRQIGYAENWVYAPTIEREREILRKTGGQVLRFIGEQSHSGSHSPYYGDWRHTGGGSLIGKACHPVTAALHLKRVEGQTLDGRPIRPRSVSARTHAITRLQQFRDAGFLRTDYHDVEDYAQVHLTFGDGTVADIFASELVLGGVNNWLEVFANNHRTRCNLNPTNALETYNPREDLFEDVYVVEKIGTKQGWSRPAVDESWQHGYARELQDFIESFAANREPLSSIELARDTIAVVYCAYLSAERQGAEVEIEL